MTMSARQILAISVCLLQCCTASAGRLRLTIVDADSRKPIPARVYLTDTTGKPWFVSSESVVGQAIPYTEQWVPIEGSLEVHTTVTAHACVCELPNGQYTLHVERGKEYIPATRTLHIEDGINEHLLPLQRWSNVAESGWYSGETHVHRRLPELPNVMQAEELNVTFPVTFWTIQSDRLPDLQPSPLRRQGPSPFGPREDRGAEPIPIDRDYVIFPRNTEYEIFSIGEQRHVLGAMFLLNHRQPFQKFAPPVGPIAEDAHRQGALIDLDKHSWPWSLMLIPVAGVDLFELSNNSVWRTQFGFRNAPANPPTWVTLEESAPGTLTEWGWLNYGFEMYYALLNCGFRLSPSAGTASGVHPVPLGHSRVYVQTGTPFDRERWLDGLKRGRSFVTTGPMLQVTVNREHPGQEFHVDGPLPAQFDVEILSTSLRPADRVEVLVNGRIVETLKDAATQTATGTWRQEYQLPVQLNETSWLAVRSVVRQPDGRRRFAHTAPWHITFRDAPIQPQRKQVEYLVQQMQAELERSGSLLPPTAVAEYKQALQVYRDLLRRAR
jgi:hypothetical protein